MSLCVLDISLIPTVSCETWVSILYYQMRLWRFKFKKIPGAAQPWWAVPGHAPKVWDGLQRQMAEKVWVGYPYGSAKRLVRRYIRVTPLVNVSTGGGYDSLLISPGRPHSGGVRPSST